MSFTLIKTAKAEDAANFIASSILNKLKSGKRVLFFVTGGSSIAVGAKVAKFLENYPHKNLTIMLTDERYGLEGHKNSNWQQLLEKGFSLPEAKLVSILSGGNCVVTTEKFNQNLEQEFKNAEYKIGLFGIGKDGHTAGILPERAMRSENLAFSYETPTFFRITMTPKAIEKLDEAVIWAQGKDKWNTLESLEKNIPTIKQPAQILKKVPLLTMFSDYSAVKINE